MPMPGLAMQPLTPLTVTLPLPEQWFTAGKPSPADSVSAGSKLVPVANLALARQYKQQGNRYSQNGQWQLAQQLYEQAVATDPTYSDAWFNLGTLHRENQHPLLALQAYQQVVKLTPSDTETWLRMGDCYQQLNDVMSAYRAYGTVLQWQPQHDVAQRKQALIRFNWAMQGKSPLQQQQALQQTAEQAYQQANTLLNSLPESLAKPPAGPAQGSPVTAKHTAKDTSKHTTMPTALRPKRLQQNSPQPGFKLNGLLAGSTSLAEYDAFSDSIRVIPELIFAHPTVLAAYLAHEYVHASDRDNMTSVEEEYRGYEASILAWQQFKQQIGQQQRLEPNLDFATALYQQDPADLVIRIAEVYRAEHKVPWQPLKNPRR
jgi:tetratricopeptide (TPR) repeat protein